MRKLALKRETLTDLTPDDLRAVVGGQESQSCQITYTCVCYNSNNCTNITNVTANVLAGGC